MEAGSAALLGMEQAINGLLAIDPIRRERLAALHGKRIAIDLQEWDLTLIFVPDANGELQLFSGERDEADGWIAGTPLARIRSASFSVSRSPSTTATLRSPPSASIVASSNAVLPAPGEDIRLIASTLWRLKCSRLCNAS